MEFGIFVERRYRVNYEFAKFIAEQDVCAEMLKQHDVKNILGHHPFAIEDVMIGRMHRHMKSISKHSELEENSADETIHNNRGVGLASLFFQVINTKSL